jgi:hypothetical protein
VDKDFQTAKKNKNIVELINAEFPVTQIGENIDAVHIPDDGNDGYIVDYTDPHNVKLHYAIKTVRNNKTVYLLGKKLPTRKNSKKKDHVQVSKGGWLQHELMILPRMYADTSDPANVCKIEAWRTGEYGIHINHKDRNPKSLDCTDLELCTAKGNNAHSRVMEKLEDMFKKLINAHLLPKDYLDNHTLSLSASYTSLADGMKDYLDAALSNKDASIFTDELKSRGILQ